MSAGAPKTIWLFGCGNMAGAMLRQWVASGVVDPAGVTAINPSPPDVPFGVRHCTSLPEEPLPDAVMIGVKPQMLDTVAPALAPRIAGVPLLLSILAGVEIASLAKRFEAKAIVRVMPNLPVALGHGAVGLCGVDPASAIGETVTALMAPLGLIPFSNTLPGIAILLLAAGISQRDGLVVLAGHVMVVLTIVYFAGLALLAYGAGQSFSLFG